MSQEFHGGVGQVAEGDINNYGINIALADKPELKSLVVAQRQELHTLRAKCEELGDDPREVWRRVHAHLGVKSISEISSDQFSDARSVLQERLSFLQEEADKRRLVGKVLRATAEKDAKAEMNNFCELSFGRVQLKNLEKHQLQKTLDFVQQLELASVPPAEQPPEAITLRNFLATHRSNAAIVFLVGVFIGGVCF